MSSQQRDVPGLAWSQLPGAVHHAEDEAEQAWKRQWLLPAPSFLNLLACLLARGMGTRSPGLKACPTRSASVSLQAPFRDENDLVPTANRRNTPLRPSPKETLWATLRSSKSLPDNATGELAFQTISKAFHVRAATRARQQVQLTYANCFSFTGWELNTRQSEIEAP